MVDRSHPTYRNPTVVEAVCELYFRRGPGNPWKPSLPGELFKIVQDDYPEMEPVFDVSVQFELGPTGMGQRVLPPRQRVRLKHRDRPILLQIAENILTVNVLKPYPGWGAMKEVVTSTWKRAFPVFEPTSVTRIGLRYINRIPREVGVPASKWLKATDLVPAAVLVSEGGFFLRVEAGVTSTRRTIVTLGEEPGVGDAASGAIIFDIDCISEDELPPDQTRLSSRIDELHDQVWQAFASATTNDLEDLLSGGQQ